MVRFVAVVAKRLTRGAGYGARVAALQFESDYREAG